MAERHGMYGTPTYKSWSEMKRRCGKSWWKDISYCPRWEFFSNFFEDMGVRPEGTSLDRIDVSGNYEPSNCRWATMETQQNNRRNNRKFNIDGEMLTIPQIARKYGFSRSNLANKIYLYKMSIDDAITYLKEGGGRHRRT